MALIETFLACALTEILDLPQAPVHDSKEPLSACHSFPDIYAKLAAQLGQGTDLLEIKMALQHGGVLGLRLLAV